MAAGPTAVERRFVVPPGANDERLSATIGEPEIAARVGLEAREVGMYVQHRGAVGRTRGEPPAAAAQEHPRADREVGESARARGGGDVGLAPNLASPVGPRDLEDDLASRGRRQRNHPPRQWPRPDVPE